MIGLKRDLVVRVKVGRPNTLHEAINLARVAEWEIGYESELNRKGPEIMTPDKITQDQDSKKSANSQERFRPYHSNAKARKVGGEFSRGIGQSRGRGMGYRNTRKDTNYENRNAKASGPSGDCQRCGEVGHLAKGCLRVIESEKRVCYICKKPDHLARECPDNKGPICYNCHKIGHLARNCSEKKNITKFCAYCKKAGHIIAECEKRQKKEDESRAEKESALND